MCQDSPTLDNAAWRAVRQRKGKVYPCLSPCDGCKTRGVMVWLAENIQACLRIFRRTQHQWLARDILHQPQGVYSVFVLWPHRTNPSNPWQNRRIYPAAYCPPGRGFSLGSNPRALPPVTQSSALQAPERMWILMLKTSNPW